MQQTYRDILVPVDGSKNSEKALEQAVEIAKRNHGKIEILNIIDIRNFSNAFGSIMDGSGDVIYSSFNAIEEYLNKLKAKIVEQHHFEQVQVHARFGSPRVVIANDFLRDYPIDLIVMGKTGSNPVERFLIGSVTDFVTRSASCDVIIIHQ